MKLKFSSIRVKLHAIYIGLYIIVIYLKLMLVKHTGKWHLQNMPKNLAGEKI